MWLRAVPGVISAGGAAATAFIRYNPSDGSVGYGGNTTGWQHGPIWIVGDVYCDGTLRTRLERECHGTYCELVSEKDLDPRRAATG